MRVLVVYSHPVETSYNAALHREVLASLARAGHEVDDCDLYAEDFNPVLSRAERLGYHDVPANLAPVRGYVERLRWAEALVFCFPTWCFGLPAMLKGFFDRVFLPGVAFDFSDPRHVKPSLTHLKRIAAVVTYGRPRWTAWAMGRPAAQDHDALPAPPERRQRPHRVPRLLPHERGHAGAAGALPARRRPGDGAHRMSETHAGIAQPLARYAAWRRAGDFILLSGVIAVDPAAARIVRGYADIPEAAAQRLGRTGEFSTDLKEGPILAQSWYVLDRIRLTLEAAGGQMSDVVRLVQYFRNLDHFPYYSRVRTMFFSRRAARLHRGRGERHAAHRRHPRRGRGDGLAAALSSPARHDPPPRTTHAARLRPAIALPALSQLDRDRGPARP